MSSVVIFYSKTGSTKIAAEIIAREKSAAICPIKENKNRKGIFGFIGGAREALKKAESEINQESLDAVNDADKIYLGTPIWAGNGTPAINSFIAQADLDKKKVVLFTMQADPQLEGSRLVAEYLSNRIMEKGGEVLQTLAFNGSQPRKSPDSESIEKQIGNVEIL